MMDSQTSQLTTTGSLRLDDNSTTSMDQLKMSEEGQRRVLKLYWAKLAEISGRKSLSEDAIDSFITRLLEFTSHASSDRTIVFMGIKMQMQMLAEIVEDYVTAAAEDADSPTATPPDTLDLLQLLDRFVEKKFLLFVQDKFNMKPTDAHYEYHAGFHRKEYLEGHMEAALLLLLGGRDFKALEPKPVGNSSVEFFKHYDSGETKTDFIEVLVDGTPRFAHRVFAEYFAAKWFAEHAAENAALLARTLYQPRFGVTRSLFDRILGRDLDLHVAVLDADLAAVRHLIDGAGVDANARDRGGRMALHLAAASATSFATREENKRQSELLDTIIDHTIDVDLEDDLFKGSPLFYADTAQAWAAIDTLLGCRADTSYLRATALNKDNPVMLTAIFAQDLDKLLAFCLDQGLAVEHSAHRRMLPRACDEGSLRVAALLIDRGADIDAVDGEPATPLASAAANGHLDMVRLLVLSAKIRSLPRGAAPATGGQPGEKFMDAVACTGHHLAAGAPAYVNAASAGGSALHCAADSGHGDVVAYLIAEGGDVHGVDRLGCTPLHKAVECGQRVVPILLDAVDADARVAYVDAVDKGGNTALHAAAAVGALKSVHLLVKAGASLAPRNDAGQTPLIVATESGRLKVCQYLLSSLDASVAARADASEFAKADHINEKDRNGMSALHSAARQGHANVASFLIGQGAYIRSRDSFGRTPLHYAAGQGQGKSLGVLLAAVERPERAGFVNVEDDDGNTALHRAAQWGRLLALEHLLKAGGSLSQVNKKQQTPLMVATEEDQHEVVRLLDGYQ